MEQFNFEQPKPALEKPDFWEKYKFGKYEEEDLEEIKEELTRVWDPKSKKEDVKDLLVGLLPDDALMVYDKYSSIVSKTKQDKKWNKFLQDYEAALAKENVEELNKLIAEIEERGINNWKELSEAYKEAEKLLVDYRQEVHQELLEKYGTNYEPKKFSLGEQGRKELMAMMENRIMVGRTPLVRYESLQNKKQKAATVDKKAA